MALRIEDYAMIGDTHTAALVGRDGSIDWLCLPRFDSGACFSRLLGDERHGYWRIGPATRPGAPAPLATRRTYRNSSLVLETEFETPDGCVRIVDCMAIREQYPEVVRLVEGVRGRVEMRMDMAVRFGYGSIVPWVRRIDGLLSATAGPDALVLWTPLETGGEDFSTIANFTISEGQSVPFVLTWYPSHDEPPRPIDAAFTVEDTEHWWESWAAMCTYGGEWRDAVVRSLITLKALTYAPTGGIVAAATTSLPEALGGSRNWDYRFCWLRDATLTLESLMRAGFYQEAIDWRDWLLRTVAGDPSALQIMYGPAGERRLDEWEVPWLPGYEGASPVRIGNAAAGQFQLDVYGEVMAALHEAREGGWAPEAAAWDLQVALMDFLESGWKQPDDGIWEVRGPRRHFTHSKVMAWVAFDRAVKAIENHGLPGPLDAWRAARDEVHREVCERAWDPERKAFTQYYGSSTLDASLLMMPLVGFLPGKDPRVVGTVDAIRSELTSDGFVMRYATGDDTSTGIDGLTGREGAFLACSFWMADCLELTGRHDDARALFTRLLSLRNDLGLLAEEYDPIAKRQVGNFPQAFSHVSLVNSACNLSAHRAVPGEIGAQMLTRAAARRRGRGARGGSSVLHSLRRSARTDSAATASPAPAPGGGEGATGAQTERKKR